MGWGWRNQAHGAALPLRHAVGTRGDARRRHSALATVSGVTALMGPIIQGTLRGNKVRCAPDPGGCGRGPVADVSVTRDVVGDVDQRNAAGFDVLQTGSLRRECRLVKHRRVGGQQKVGGLSAAGGAARP